MMMRPEFWKKYTLEELTPQEWEALCDGCGRCCLHKLEYEESLEIDYTNIACKLLDLQTVQCTDYLNRQKHVPDCVQLTPETVKTINWLPTTCAYRRIAEKKPLLHWHPLISGDKNSPHRTKMSVQGRAVSEIGLTEDDFHEHVIRWVKA